MSALEIVRDLEERIAVLSDFEDSPSLPSIGFREKRKRLLEDRLSAVTASERRRIFDEFESWGPLTALLEQNDWTEILINGPDSLWVERDGKLQRVEENFLSKANYDRMMTRLCLEAGCDPNVEAPSADGNWRGLRVHVTRPPVAKDHMIAALRKHPENPWSLQTLQEAGWCSFHETELLRKLVHSHLNFLVIGSTGSGKTSAVNALLKEAASERSAILEDSDEIAVPAGPSVKLLTRKDAHGLLKEVTLTDLVRQSLRLRPDRLVVGEIRGGEAKDFLLALSTGHEGSFGTLHAATPQQALLRLEMLIQMGAPQWGLTTVRRLIHSSLHAVVVIGRDQNGKRRFRGIHRIVSLEENGFLTEPVDQL